MNHFHILDHLHKMDATLGVAHWNGVIDKWLSEQQSTRRDCMTGSPPKLPAPTRPPNSSRSCVRCTADKLSRSHQLTSPKDLLWCGHVHICGTWHAPCGRHAFLPRSIGWSDHNRLNVWNYENTSFVFLLVCHKALGFFSGNLSSSTKILYLCSFFSKLILFSNNFL